MYVFMTCVLKSMPNGHDNHLDVINCVRRSGSIPQFIEDYQISDGIIYNCVKNNVPFDNKKNDWLSQKCDIMQYKK